jgi:hypothetical protein
MKSEELESMGRLASLVEVFILLVAAGSTCPTETSGTGACFIPCLLLTLQSLLLIVETSLASTFSKGLKEIVVNVCRYPLDHPSHLVREAAVRVRNVWIAL